MTSTASGESFPANGRPESTPTRVSLCPNTRSRNVSCVKHSLGSDAPHAACGKPARSCPALRAGSRKWSCTSITRSSRSSTLDAAAGSIVVGRRRPTNEAPPGAEVPLLRAPRRGARAQRREHRSRRRGRHEELAPRHGTAAHEIVQSPRERDGPLRRRPGPAAPARTRRWIAGSGRAGAPGRVSHVTLPPRYASHTVTPDDAGVHRVRHGRRPLRHRLG